MTAYGFSALAGVVFIFVRNNSVAIPYVLFGSKLGVASAMNNNYLANFALFPVDIRSTSFGVCNVFGRFGGVVGPLAAELEMPLPLYLFVAATALYAFLILFLKENR